MTKREEHRVIREAYARELKIELRALVKKVRKRENIANLELDSVVDRIGALENAALVDLHFDSVEGPGDVLVMQIKDGDNDNWKYLKIGTTTSRDMYENMLRLTHPVADHIIMMSEPFPRRLAAKAMITRKLKPYLVVGHPTWFKVDFSQMRSIVREIHHYQVTQR